METPQWLTLRKPPKVDGPEQNAADGMGNWMKLGTHGQRDHHFIRNFGRFEAFEQGPLR